MTAEWNEKFTTCWLRNEDDSIFGRLHLRQWWRPNTRTPEAAWAIELLNPDSDDPPLFVALVQMPALRADTAAVRNDLVARAVKAKLNGEEPIAPPAGPIDERDWRDIVEGLDRLFSAWVDAETAFHNAAARDDPAAGGARWVALTDALNRLYAIDSALKTLWKKLPADLREDASAWSDQYADKTIIHNRRIDPAFDPQTAAGWEAWRQRQRTGRPYEHWAGPLLAGLFHPDFFTGLRWVRGQLTYHALPEPIELRQLRLGDEPRWKWKNAAAISTEGGNERPFYEEHIAGRDVLGVFGWLIDVFVDAQRIVGRLRVRADTRRR